MPKKGKEKKKGGGGGKKKGKKDKKSTGKEPWQTGYWVNSPAGFEWSDRGQYAWENGLEY